MERGVAVAILAHQPLDDEELRLSMDDIHTLEALEHQEDHDVDMDIGLDAAADVDDVDGFRPSAMLDRRLEEEYGGAFYSTCFQASELVEKDLDGGFVDIEQMLLTESEEFLTSQFAGHAHATGALNGGDHRMLRAEITARHFVHAKSASGGGSSIGASSSNDDAARLVLLKQAIASSAVSSSSIFNMPPKYFDSVQSSPQKRRAHRRTFGERAQPFGFDRTNRHSCIIKQDVLAQPRYFNDGHDAVAITNDENCPPSTAVDDDEEEKYDNEVIQMKEEVVDVRVQVCAPNESVDEMMDEDVRDEDGREKASVVVKQEHMQPPVFVPFTGFRSISDDEHLHRATTPISTADEDGEEKERARTTLRTPLHRSLLSPTPSKALEQSHHHSTPLQQQASGCSSRSMSPADAFEKVAVVQVRDSPGRVDKFEWKIGALLQHGSSTPEDSGKKQQRPLLASELGKVDAFASASGDLLAASSGLTGTATTAAGSSAVLPPRYFRGVTSSPQKRRVHSTTFGTFARSFSFTGTPLNDL